MLKCIVVGVDGSPPGRRALEWAVDAAEDEVHAVHAVAPAMELIAAGFQIDTRPLVERLTSKLEGEWTAGLRNGNAELFTHLIEDAPVPALLDIAVAYHADAVAVGERGQSSSTKMVGATTSRLTHLSDEPIVVMPSRGRVADHGTPDVIVVGIGDEPVEDAELVAWASRVAQDSDTHIELVHSQGGRASAERQADRSRLDDWLGRQQTPNPACVVTVATDPLTALVDASQHASLVVVGSHRSSRLAAYLTGALANHLPTVCRCPVAIVPLTPPRP